MQHCIGGRVDYCAPNVYSPSPDRLLRNRGDGTFEDVSLAAGIHAVARRGLGVVIEDFDQDGWPDVYVANDGDANSLWMNQRNGTFRDDGVLVGVAVDSQGKAEASMGIAVGDVDGDGANDLFVTNLRGETNALYRNEGRFFSDVAGTLGLDDASRPFTGFGAALFDADLDGDLDLAVANGAVQYVKIWPGAQGPPFWLPYAQPNQLFRFDAGRFVEIPRGSDPFTEAIEVSRGLAAADLDGDGDLDLGAAGVASRPGARRGARGGSPRSRQHRFAATLRATAGAARAPRGQPRSTL